MRVSKLPVHIESSHRLPLRGALARHISFDLRGTILTLILDETSFTDCVMAYMRHWKETGVSIHKLRNVVRKVELKTHHNYDKIGPLPLSTKDKRRVIFILDGASLWWPSDKTKTPQMSLNIPKYEFSHDLFNELKDNPYLFATKLEVHHWNLFRQELGLSPLPSPSS